MEGRSENLGVVIARTLGIALSNNSGAVTLYRTIRMQFKLEYPSAIDHLSSRRKLNKFPGPIRNQSRDFDVTSLSPLVSIRRLHSSLVGARICPRHGPNELN